MPIEQLFRNNADWAERIEEADPEYFGRLCQQQAPDYLWIGCSDSRVPANQIVGLEPGELFVHRNVANLVVPSDLNLLAVLQFAVENLGVKHVMVTGHYGCGGVRAALRRVELGLIDNWLHPLREIYRANRAEIDALPDETTQVDRLCELNVMAQTRNVAATPIVQDAWARGQTLAIHGWIYALSDGRLRDLKCTIRGPEEIDPALRMTAAEDAG